jgi:E3 ubiquitin-protein ligase BAH
MKFPSSNIGQPFCPQLKKMHTNNSKAALKAFLKLNSSLLVFNQFYTVNQTAVTKILKKHDKRSGLTYVPPCRFISLTLTCGSSFTPFVNSASAEFPVFMQNDHFFASGMLEMVYDIINSRLITIIPQLEDYCCPVCYGTHDLFFLLSV